MSTEKKASTLAVDDNTFVLHRAVMMSIFSVLMLLF